MLRASYLRPRELGLCLFLAMIGCSGPDDVTPRAQKFAELLGTRRYAEAVDMCSASTRSVMPPAMLERMWAELVLHHGDFVGLGAARQEPHFRSTRVIVEATMAREVIEIAVDFNLDREVAGLWFRPLRKAPPADEPPPPAGVLQRQLVTGAPGWPLTASLLLPEGPGPHPAVLLVAAAGPHDKDESVGPNRPFRDLAVGLARRGVASLRYDKRTRAHAERFDAAAVATLTIDQEIVDDAAAALELLLQQPEVDAARTAIVGHDLGGMLAPRIAAITRPSALVLLGAPSRPLEDVLLAQTTTVLAHDGLDEGDHKRLAELEKKAATVKSGDYSASTDAGALPLGLPATWWRSLAGYDAVASARATGLPLLALRGAFDYQTTAADLAAWCAGAPRRTTCRELPGLNHLMMPSQGGVGPQEYQRPGELDATVIDAVAEFVRGPGA